VKNTIIFAGRTAGVILLALFVNLAVAWACAAWSPLRHGTNLPDHYGCGYPKTWAGGPYREQGWWTTERGFGFTQWTDNVAHGAEGDFRHWSVGCVPYREAGWPLPSFRSTVLPFHSPTLPREPVRWELPPGVILERGIQTADLPRFLRVQSERRLPLVPVWPGILVNTAFYSILLLGLAKLRD